LKFVVAPGTLAGRIESVKVRGVATDLVRRASKGGLVAKTRFTP